MTDQQAIAMAATLWDMAQYESITEAVFDAGGEEQ